MILKHKGLLDVQPTEPSVILANRELLDSSTGGMIAINAFLVWRLGGRIQITGAELRSFLDLGRTFVQENVNTRVAGPVIQLSLPRTPPPPHRDSPQPPKG